MTERRIQFTVSVTYDTPRDKVARIPHMLREIVESQSPVRFDRAHFKALGDSALVFEVVYFVLTPDYNQYMDMQQAMNLAILEQFETQRDRDRLPDADGDCANCGFGIAECGFRNIVSECINPHSAIRIPHFRSFPKTPETDSGCRAGRRRLRGGTAR